MRLKKDILQIIFGALLTALFIQMGILSPANDFWSNVISSMLVYFASRILSFMLGGR